MPRNLTFYENINPNTIGQYIGLRDNQEKDIYECDIIECILDNGKKEIYEVKFNEKTFCYQLVNDNNSINIDFTLKSRIKVMGNKYDHKEV